MDYWNIIQYIQWVLWNIIQYRIMSYEAMGEP